MNSRPRYLYNKKNTAGAINAIVMQEQSGCFKILLVRGKTVFRGLLENCTGSFFLFESVANISLYLFANKNYVA